MVFTQEKNNGKFKRLAQALDGLFMTLLWCSILQNRPSLKSTNDDLSSITPEIWEFPLQILMFESFCIQPRVPDNIGVLWSLGESDEKKQQKLTQQEM